MKVFKKDRITKIFNVGLFLLFALLIFKDPFSQRTLIPNFEPYPDTIYYINPALNFAKGDGFNVTREGRVIKTSVPPLYSISLIPGFILKPDPRMAYYSNAALGFISLFLFWLISKKLFTNSIIISFLVILYVTNFFIYWIPSIVMAENLTLTIYLAIILLFLSETTVISSMLIPFLAVAVYATKYANIPITATVILIYFIKIISSKFHTRQKVCIALSFIVALAVFFSMLAGFEWITKGSNIIAPIIGHLSSIYQSIPRVDQPKIATQSSWFGVEYIAKNLPLYINSLVGNPNRFLWDQTPLVPKFVAILGLIGIFGALFHKQMRYIAFSLLLFLFASVFFMSAFYSFDARYIYIAIPTLLIGFGLFLTCVKYRVGAGGKLLINLLILITICVYLINNSSRIKSQISLNLKYSETPWNYISVLKSNEYFTIDKVIAGKKPILISALPPFLVDYYTNNNYTLLPLSYEQEFRDRKEIIWGANDYSNLPKLYTKYLNEGYSVYVSRSGLGNEGYTNRDFNTIIEKFDTQLIQKGCYDQCNIYSVKLKERE